MTKPPSRYRLRSPHRWVPCRRMRSCRVVGGRRRLSGLDPLRRVMREEGGPDATSAIVTPLLGPSGRRAVLPGRGVGPSVPPRGAATEKQSGASNPGVGRGLGSSPARESHWPSSTTLSPSSDQGQATDRQGPLTRMVSTATGRDLGLSPLPQPPEVLERTTPQLVGRRSGSTPLWPLAVRRARSASDDIDP